MSDVDLYTVTYKVRTLESRVDWLEKERKQDLADRVEESKARAERERRKTEHLMWGLWFVYALILAVSITIAVTKAVVAP